MGKWLTLTCEGAGGELGVTGAAFGTDGRGDSPFWACTWFDTLKTTSPEQATRARSSKWNTQIPTGITVNPSVSCGVDFMGLLMS